MKTIVPHVIEYEVRGFDCGYGGPLRPLPMANFLQEAAAGHAYALGFGIDDMRAKGQTWMLAKIDLRVDRLPRESEAVRARTWPSGLDRLLALRDILLETDEGESLVRAVYAYLVVDIEARRPLRPERAQPALAELDVSGLGHCIADRSFGAGQIDVAQRVVSFAETASARHLDDNGHVNNAHIVDWLVDAVPRAARGSGELAGLRIDFLREALEGDLLELAHGPAAREGEAAVALTEIAREGEVIARAETRWR
jgi:acyl-CoA thioesterase FadM